MSPPPPLLLLPLLLLSSARPSAAFSAPSCKSSCTFSPSKAVYAASANPKGACGYLDHGVTVNDGDVAAVGKLYYNGTGCGACYRLRCTDAELCDAGGVRVIATDHGFGAGGVDFILTSRTFAALAKPHLGPDLLAKGVVDVQYCRVPCAYPGHNLVLRMMDNSEYPGYLAISFLYQWGKYDIVAVQVSSMCHKWIPMRHAFGKVWDLDLGKPAPTGPLNLKFFTVTETGEEEWLYLMKIIPAGWKPGDEYDTGL